MKMEFTADPKKLDGMMTTLKTMSGKFHELMHVASVSAALHLIEHGNPHYMNVMFQNMGDGTRREPLAKFWIKHTGVSYVKPKAGEGGVGTFKPDAERLKTLREEMTADAEAFVGALAEQPFWMIQKESIFREWSLQQKLGVLLKQGEAYAKGEKPNGETLTEEEKAKVDVKGLQQLRGFITRLKLSEDMPSVAVN